MRLLPGALTAALLFVVSAQANEFHAWPSGYRGPAGYDVATIEHDPWIDPISAPPIFNDAYVFADVAPGLGLSQDAIAAAVRFDVERVSRASNRTAIGSVRLPNAPGRVASVFARFVQVGLTYASVEVARGRGGPASLAVQPALEPALLAMTSPVRQTPDR